MNKSVLWRQIQMILSNLSVLVTSLGKRITGAEKKITVLSKKVDAVPGMIPKLNLVNGNAEGAVRSVTAKEETSDYQLGENAIAIGGQSEASGENSVAIGDSAKATELWSYALGFAVKATAKRSHAEGELTVASGDTSHAEGSSSVANGSQSHAEGNETRAEGRYSHAEGYGGTTLIRLTGDANATTYETNYHSSIRPGKLVKYGDVVAEVTASTGASITLNKTLSSTALSGAWGTLYYGAAVGDASHSEGRETYAIGAASHSEGNSTMAIGRQSHAEGYDTIAAGRYQHAQGKYNIADDNDRYAHIVGNGGGNGSRSNAHTLDWDGNAWFKGKVYVGGTSMDDATELGAGGGGEYTPPDWGTKRENGYLMPETTLVVDPETGSAAYAPVIDVVAGEQYTVKWNGTDYVCNADAIDLNGLPVVALGNHGAIMGGESTNEPFVIVTASGDAADMLGVGVIIMPLDGSMSPAVSIYGGMEIVQKIEKKYISFPEFPTINLMEYGMTEIVTRGVPKTVQLTEEQTQEVDKAFKAGAFWCVTSGVEHINENTGATVLLHVGVSNGADTAFAYATIEVAGSYAKFLKAQHAKGDPSISVSIEQVGSGS